MSEDFDDLVYTKNEFGEVWKKVTDQDIKNKVKSCFKNFEENRFCPEVLSEVIEDEVGQSIPNNQQDRRFILEIYAGKNGSGDWRDYLTDMAMIMNNLHEMFESVYLVDWNNDCADDVSVARVGLSGLK